MVNLVDGQDDKPLEPRTAVLTVEEIGEYVSKSGNLSIKLVCKSDDGSKVYEYIRPQRDKIAALCKACGVDMPKGNQFDESVLLGKSFRAALKVELGTDGYRDKHRIDRYLPPKPAAVAATETRTVHQQRVAAAIAGKSRQASAAPAPADDDGIPF